MCYGGVVIVGLYQYFNYVWLCGYNGSVPILFNYVKYGPTGTNAGNCGRILWDIWVCRNICTSAVSCA